MIKRLSISLLLMGLAAFSLGAAAFAWFSDSATGEVTISSGTVDLQFRIDQDCNGDGPIDGFDSDFQDITTVTEVFDWVGIVPGDTTSDCVEVLNAGNGTLDVYVSHGNFDPSNDNDLRNATLWQYNAKAGGPAWECVQARPQDDQYDTGRGCLLRTIDPGESFEFEVNVLFEDTGSGQNTLQGMTFAFDVAITGYTG